MRLHTGRDAAFAMAGSLLGSISSVAIAIATDQLPGAHASQVALVGLLVCLILLSFTVAQVHEPTASNLSVEPELSRSQMSPSEPGGGPERVSIASPSPEVPPQSKTLLGAEVPIDAVTPRADPSSTLIAAIVASRNGSAQPEVQCPACGSFTLSDTQNASRGCSRAWCDSSPGPDSGYIRLRHRPVQSNELIHNNTSTE